MTKQAMRLKRLLIVLQQRTDAAQQRYAAALHQARLAQLELEHAQQQCRDGIMELQRRKTAIESGIIGQRHSQSSMALANHSFDRIREEENSILEAVEAAHLALEQETESMDAARREWVEARLKQEKMAHACGLLTHPAPDSEEA